MLSSGQDRTIALWNSQKLWSLAQDWVFDILFQRGIPVKALPFPEDLVNEWLLGGGTNKPQPLSEVI